MQHYDIWRAIDALAAENGLSASGLARKAGLDPTAFNPSKRTGPDGRARWPSTESVAKVLEATGTSLDAFASLVSGTPMNFRSAAVRPVRRIPLIGLAQAGSAGYFDDGGFPSGAGWDEISVPEIPDPNAYALEISGDSTEPVFRDGDTIIVSPTATVRRGDRVVVKTVEGEVLAKQLKRQTAKTVELASLNPEHPDRVLNLGEIAFMARVIWASQ